MRILLNLMVNFRFWQKWMIYTKILGVVWLRLFMYQRVTPNIDILTYAGQQPLTALPNIPFRYHGILKYDVISWNTKTWWSTATRNNISVLCFPILYWDVSIDNFLFFSLRLRALSYPLKACPYIVVCWSMYSIHWCVWAKYIVMSHTLLYWTQPC